MKKFVFTILILLACAFTSFAQSAGLNFTLGFPEGEFKDNLKEQESASAAIFCFGIQPLCCLFLPE